MNPAWQRLRCRPAPPARRYESDARMNGNSQQLATWGGCYQHRSQRQQKKPVRTRESGANNKSTVRKVPHRFSFGKQARLRYVENRKDKN